MYFFKVIPCTIGYFIMSRESLWNVCCTGRHNGFLERQLFSLKIFTVTVFFLILVEEMNFMWFCHIIYGFFLKNSFKNIICNLDCPSAHSSISLYWIKLFTLLKCDSRKCFWGIDLIKQLDPPESSSKAHWKYIHSKWKMSWKFTNSSFSFKFVQIFSRFVQFNLHLQEFYSNSFKFSAFFELWLNILPLTKNYSNYWYFI